MVKTRPSTAGGTGLIPGRGTKIPHAGQHSQRKKKKERKRTLSSPSTLLMKVVNPNQILHNLPEDHCLTIKGKDERLLKIQLTYIQAIPHKVTGSEEAIRN